MRRKQFGHGIYQGNAMKTLPLPQNLSMLPCVSFDTVCSVVLWVISITSNAWIPMDPVMELGASWMKDPDIACPILRR